MPRKDPAHRRPPGAGNPEYKHPFLVEREVKRIAFIVVSSDRGLCGGLNTNLFRPAVRSIREWKEKGVEPSTRCSATRRWRSSSASAARWWRRPRTSATSRTWSSCSHHQV